MFYKKNGVLVEGALNNLKQSMIQFSHPPRSKNPSRFNGAHYPGDSRDQPQPHQQGPGGRRGPEFISPYDSIGYLGAAALTSQPAYGIPMPSPFTQDMSSSQQSQAKRCSFQNFSFSHPFSIWSKMASFPSSSRKRKPATSTSATNDFTQDGSHSVPFSQGPLSQGFSQSSIAPGMTQESFVGEFQSQGEYFSQDQYGEFHSQSIQEDIRPQPGEFDESGY